MPVGAAPNEIDCPTRLTVNETLLLVTPPDVAVMDALPCAAPVTVVPFRVTDVPVRLNVGAIVNVLPYWSTPVAVNTEVSPTLRVVFVADKVTLERAGG